MSRLYLVRHCEAEGNKLRIFQGHIDSDITDNGKKQLESLAQRFSTIPLDAVWASPLLRARKTAEAVNYYHQLSIQFDDDLKEINGGCWEGKSWTELPSIYPQMSDDWLHRPWLFSPDNGETMCCVYKRISQAIVRIASLHPDQNIAIVTHGCAIRNALCWARNWPIEQLNNVEWCDNTAISVVEVDSSGQPKLIDENDSSHLSQQTSTFEKQSWWRKENQKVGDIW